MRRRLPLLALALVILAACSSGKKSGSPARSSLPLATTTTVPAAPVVATIVSPQKGSVQGIGGKGMVIDLTFVAKDPSVLPAEFRLGGALPSPATPVKPGHNPAFPGLIVVLSTTGPALGGPATNLANLFQIVSPSIQPDGSERVSAIWTNTQDAFGTDLDVTMVALTVSGTAPDVLPATAAELSPTSNPAQVAFHVAGGGTAAGTASTTTTTSSGAKATTTSTTVKGATTTTAAGGTTTSTKAPTATSTSVPATTTTTKFLGLF